ncbi:MAG: hypothetical protein DRH56_10610 [Deltaproteobacteria bacterium]|nr:MAG: hypothetical protein DRH56_10610 [Deltaproteobacteria bacterium]
MPDDIPGKIGFYEKRFGLIAIEKGFILPRDLFRALTIQARENAEEGTHRLLGEILLDEDLMSVAQIEEVVAAVVRKKGE